jgi:carbonic anhydrase/acetyltransferase-like protein (isoleucine patch superfamily)
VNLLELGDNVFVHPSAVLIGLITIGTNSSIWANTVIRADNNTISIGNGVNIQDNSTLHVDSKQGLVIGDYSLIGHNCVLHGCKIGRACMIGIGSILYIKQSQTASDNSRLFRVHRINKKI